jgi:3',5'-cyclic AMP phosphodiesterase CpdA
MKQKAVLLLALFIVCIVPGFGQEQPFYFVMIADTQLGMHASDRNFEQETASYEFAVATINRLKPEFVIVLGDLVNKVEDEGQIREFLRISRKIDPFIPLYYVAGNHDVGNIPTPELVAAYRKIFGRDYYSFREGLIYGIVLNSSLMVAPQNVEADYDAQLSWLKKELETAKNSDSRHIIVFQHHPYFLEDAKEADSYGNVPLKRRQAVLDLLHDYGVHYVFAGHVHTHSIGKDGDLDMVAVGPVAMSFDVHGSGMMLAAVTPEGVQYRYYGFNRLPNVLTTK